MSQAKPDPRAEQAGATVPCARIGFLVPQEHCHHGWGLLSILPDVKSRPLGNPGVGLALRISENMTPPKWMTLLPSRPDNTLGRCEPGKPQEGEGSHAAQQDSQGRWAIRGWRFPGLFFRHGSSRPGQPCSGGAVKVDDTNERLEHCDKGGDPEAHSEKPTEPTKGPSETLNRWRRQKNSFPAKGQTEQA